MRHLLEFFNLNHAVALVLLIGVLHFVGARMAEYHSAPRWWARGFAAAGFLLYLVFAIDTFKPTTPPDYLTLSLQALLAMGMVRGLALVTLPVVRFLYRLVWAGPTERQRARAEEKARRDEIEQRERETAERNRAEQERKAADERRRQEEIANRPPPPTRQQRMAAAKQQYESTLAALAGAGLDETELQAAREQAKQQYLRELDEAIR